MIKEYIDPKDGKKKYEIIGEYLGKHPITGKEKRVKKKGLKSMKEATKYLADKIAEFERSSSEIIVDKNMTLNTLYSMWYETKVEIVKTSTLRNIENIWKLYIKDHIGDMKVKAIFTPILQNIFNKYYKSYSAGTIRLIKTKLTEIFEYAIDLDIIFKNPAKKVKLPKKPTKEQHFHEKEDAVRLLELIKQDVRSPKMYVYARLLLYSGARRGEIGALKTTSSFNFKTNEIYIDETITIDVNGKLTYGTPKTETSKRAIGMDIETMKIVKDYINSLKIIPHYLFSKHDYSYIYKVLKRVIEKNNLKDSTLHDLRRTHATLLAEANVDPKVTQERLGHANINTTLNIYTKVTKKQKEEVADKFANFLG